MLMLSIYAIMPTIKKKGALFAIYADSPAATKPSSTTKAPAPAASPSKRSTVPREKRKALTTVQNSVSAKRHAPAPVQDESCKPKTKLVVLMDKPLASAPRRTTKVDKENVPPAHNTRSASRSPVKTKSTTAGVKGIKKGTLVAKTVPGLKGGKRYEVEWDPDPILGDVSAVYGANPSGEPEGFKDVVSTHSPFLFSADDRPSKFGDPEGDLPFLPPTPR